MRPAMQWVQQVKPLSDRKKPTTYADTVAEREHLISMARVLLVVDVTDDEIWAEFHRLAAERGEVAPYDVMKSLNASRPHNPELVALYSDEVE